MIIGVTLEGVIFDSAIFDSRSWHGPPVKRRVDTIGHKVKLIVTPSGWWNFTVPKLAQQMVNCRVVTLKKWDNRIFLWEFISLKNSWSICIIYSQLVCEVDQL